MSTIDDVKPNELHHLYDLLVEVGVDVSDWPNYNGANIRTNPRYCYKWSFVEPRKVVVLCIWFENMKIGDGVIFQDRNLRQLAQSLNPPTSGRAIQMDRDIHTAWATGLPVRAIICDKNSNMPTRATRRILDPLPWSIASYDLATGQCRLVRGLELSRFIDQFSIKEMETHEARRRDRTGTEPVRNYEVKQRALNRAQGKCEYCGEDGFITDSGQIYLESHHIIPFSKGGSDIDGNVAALCPNHHRQAHHGVVKDVIRETLQRKLADTDITVRS